jgi:hypothetical protein
MVLPGENAMARERVENGWVVIGACLLAVLGVMAIRVILRLDFRLWPVFYLAMGLTAAIRRTSEGSDCTIFSALRGIVCLILGLHAAEWLGYPGASYRSIVLVPEGCLKALEALMTGIENGQL